MQNWLILNKTEIAPLPGRKFPYGRHDDILKVLPITMIEKLSGLEGVDELI